MTHFNCIGLIKYVFMNNKIVKAGLLVLILAVPAFLFLGAHFTGKNHFDLPKQFPIGLDTSVVDGVEIYDTVYHKIGPFEFLDEEGNVFSSEDLKGKISVVSFIFTNCKMECTVITSNLTKVNQSFKDSKDVNIISFTVDPGYDTPDVMLEYKRMYDIENPNWKFLCGKEKKYTYEVLQKQFYATAMEDADKSIGFIHSQKVVLVDKEGIIREYYEGINSDSIDDLIAAIEILQNADQ